MKTESVDDSMSFGCLIFWSHDYGSFIIIIIVVIIISIIIIIIIIIIIVIVIVTIIIVIFRINWDWKDTGKCALPLRVGTAPRQLISNRSENYWHLLKRKSTSLFQLAYKMQYIKYNYKTTN